jgi:hypothetical protein
LQTPYTASKGRSNNRTLINEVTKLSGIFTYLKPGEKRRVKEALAGKRNRKKVRKEQD